MLLGNHEINARWGISRFVDDSMAVGRFLDVPHWDVKSCEKPLVLRYTGVGSSIILSFPNDRILSVNAAIPLAPSYVFTPLPFVTRHGQILGSWAVCRCFCGLVVGVTKSTGRIDISISKPNGLVTSRLASAAKKDKKRNLKPTDKENPKKIRRLERLKKLFSTSYVFNQVL